MKTDHRPDMVRMYRTMFSISRFEQQVKQLYRADEALGAVHLSSVHKMTP